MSTTPVEPATPTSYVPSRRTVLRAAAWTAPAVSVAVAVPAYAACSPATTRPATYKIAWGSGIYTRSSAASGSAVVPGSVLGAEPVSVTIASSVSSAKVRRTAQNLAGSGQGLELHHARAITAGRDHRQVVTFSFSREITGLSFSIKDIDSDKDGWWDRVELSGTREATIRKRPGKNGGPYVLGSGMERDEWRFFDRDTVMDNSGDTRGQVDVRYTEPVSVVALTYWSSVGGSNQRIWLSDFSFTATSC